MPFDRFAAARACRRGGDDKRPRRWRYFFVSLLIATLIGGGFLWHLATRRPVGNPPSVRVQIPKGATGDAIVAVLERAGLAPNTTITYYVLRWEGTFDAVQAGVYEIPGDANAFEVAAALSGPASAEHLELTLIPGTTVWEAQDRLDALSIGPPGGLESLAEDHLYVSSLGVPVGETRRPRPDGAPQTYLEGFLYPDTYFLPVGANAKVAAERAVARFREVWSSLKTRYRSDLLAIKKRYGVSEHDLVVLASLIEEEVRFPDEAARVAGVFYNRLAEKMRLQTDPTLMYHPQRVAQAPTPTNRKDRSNPYNTYARGGLPPGPICSPSERSLLAALRPERHDYLYFVATGDARGSHAFARTLPEHNANVKRYLRDRAEDIPHR